jgi:DNA-binding NtrC family response regulator
MGRDQFHRASFAAAAAAGFERGDAAGPRRALTGDPVYPFGSDLEFIAGSPAMQPVVDLIRRTGPSRASVLVTGESGTGKTLIASILHSLSPRASRPLIALTAGEAPVWVIERELFGYETGGVRPGSRAGLLEAANGGTLFIDEIADLPSPLQLRLLRAIESGEYERAGSCETRRADVRIIAATSADLAGEVREGRFRADLLRRLKAIEAAVPPLRERREDVPRLARSFLARHVRRHALLVTGLDEEAMAALLGHRWPGNVRELSRVIECGALAARGALVTAGDLSFRACGDRSPRLEDLNLIEAQKLLVRQALVRFDGRLSPAAKALGVTPAALLRLRRSFGLDGVSISRSTRSITQRKDGYGQDSHSHRG